MGGETYESASFWLPYLSPGVTHQPHQSHFRWRSLCCGTNSRGRIPLSGITKMFEASENPESMAQWCRLELGFAGRKVGRGRRALSCRED